MENSNQTPQDQKVHDQMSPIDNNSGKSKVIPIFLSITVVIIIAIGAYALGAKQSQTVVQNSVQTTPVPSPTPIDETANWKTYILPENTFSFKYPSDWEYDVTDFVFTIKGKEYPTTYITFGKPFTEKERKEFGYIDINDAPKIYFSFSFQYASHTDFTNLTVDNLVEELINKRFSIVDNPTTLLLNNNIQAREVGYACQEGCADILFKKNTTIFDFSTRSGGNLTPLTQRQILSTFRFTTP